MAKYENYLKDLVSLLTEYAQDARRQARDEGTDFSIGYLAGFHRVLSLMQQQCVGFDIPLEEIGLQGIDPDDDLV